MVHRTLSESPNVFSLSSLLQHHQKYIFCGVPINRCRIREKLVLFSWIFACQSLLFETRACMLCRILVPSKWGYPVEPSCLCKNANPIFCSVTECPLEELTTIHSEHHILLVKSFQRCLIPSAQLM